MWLATFPPGACNHQDQVFAIYTACRAPMRQQSKSMLTRVLFSGLTFFSGLTGLVNLLTGAYRQGISGLH